MENILSFFEEGCDVGGGSLYFQKKVMFFTVIMSDFSYYAIFSPKFDNFRVFFSKVPVGAGAARFEIGAGSEQVQRGFGAGAAI